MINALVTAGVWAKLDALYMFAAADSATALTNLVSSSYGATAVNSPTFTVDQGYTGNGSSSYISTGFNPTTASSPKLVQNSGHIGGWALANAAAGSSSLFGNVSGTYLLNPRNASNQLTSCVNTGAATVVTSITDSRGHSLHNRSGAATVQVYKDGASIGSDVTTSSAPANETIDLLRISGAFSARLIGAAHFGSSLTSGEVTAAYNAIHTYMQSVAGAP